ncbi:hypothetical protein EG68_05830 [Paragonimus skrjabini miyazakii]|uniref:Uncharacterized protein n=1 Tax=Paragonimus skrjabini miyazakii TaxID=59628 RepID=A0A8S9YPH4_9TREM|nr:hypothetical protein EG68_05830 [Paragonimus skrjabini miyazakii]
MKCLNWSVLLVTTAFHTAYLRHSCQAHRLRVFHKKRSAEKRLSFPENTPPGVIAANCATPHSPLSSSPYNRDIPPSHFGELTDSFRGHSLTSPTFTGTDACLDYVIKTVRQLSIRLKRVECKLDFLAAQRRKRHAEDVEIAASCTEFRLLLASEVEVMQLETKLQDSDTQGELVNYHYESVILRCACCQSTVGDHVAERFVTY